MGILLVKGKLVKLFKASTVSLVVREKWNLVDQPSLVPTSAITFVALGDKIWSPWIRSPKFVATGFPSIAHISAKLIVFDKMGSFQS